MAKRKKNRRIRKPKYLSLRLQFPGEKAAKSIDDDHIISSVPTSINSDYNQQEEVEVEVEVGGDDYDNMEYLLSTSDGGGATTTLTDLLRLDSDAVPVPVSDADEVSPSASVSLSYVSDQAMNLVRTALRSREREHSSNDKEERYVRFSQVVNEEVTSSREESGDYNYNYSNSNSNSNNYMKNEYHKTLRLSLKLDYQEIINAWSDKGGFYVDHSDLPQTVPDINYNPFSPPAPGPGAMSDVGVGVGVGGGLWGVPEFNGWPAEPMLKMEEVVVGVPHDQVEEEEELKWKKAAAGQREASVLRYKEKKRNRLFSKTIRYQVRKENAQKRPRFKGRFVKRS